MDLQSLIRLVQIKLRESLREENSGTYGVNCFGSISRIPKEEFQITISFTCSPENVNKLKDAAIEVIRKIQAEGCEETDLQKVTEGFRRDREVSLKENNYWQSKLLTLGLHVEKIMDQAEFDSYFSKLTTQDIAIFANRYLNISNYADFVLMPEK